MPSTGLDDPTLHRDIGFLCVSFLKDDFAFDFLANLPILVY